jgi:hypothetical protein
MKPFLIGLAIAAAGASSAGAQTVRVDPLQCWWRTTAAAIRVGEPFGVVLTCAVLETADATVVVDRDRLEPPVVELPPFEVLGGSHGADLHANDRRFFQYEYRLRLVAENLFGKDVALPELKLTYRVQSAVGQHAALQGRDHAYLMPPLPLRVLALVPANASDIRDSSTDTFADLDQRIGRANLFLVGGGVLLALAALLAILTLVRIVSRFRKPATADARLISDAAILRGVGRELAGVGRLREGTGWTSGLAGRALAALRLVAAYALERRIGIMPAGAEGLAEDGRLILRVGRWRPKRIAVSASVTPQALAPAEDDKHDERLSALGRAMSTLTAAQYGRDEKHDDRALDEALAAGVAALRDVRIKHTWIMKQLAAWRAGAAVDTRAWSR